MVTDTRTLTTNNWQMSLQDIGEVVTDADDIRQCIAIILFTRIGSDPMRPLFGCGYADYIDKPINTAAPNMVAAMLKAIKLYEPRVSVKSITYQVLNAQIIFNLQLLELATGALIRLTFPDLYNWNRNIHSDDYGDEYD